VDIIIVDEKWPKTLFEDDELRESGLHLGELTRSLMDSSGLGYKGEGFSDMQLTAEIGLLWERALSKIMREKYAVRPPQICVDGIWMSPDGVSTDDPLCSLSIGADPEGVVPLVVEEYKARWASTRQSPCDNFAYMVQVKSYCRAMGTNVCIMRIFHVMGDYKGGGPVYRVARLKFTDEELEQNWSMILKHKEKMERGK
jgi:hypothetical protein